jgi:hypothetical protein
MDVGRSVAFPFHGPAWFGRVLVGALLEIAPLLLSLPLLLAAFRRVRCPTLLLAALWLLAILISLLCRAVVLGYLRRIARGVLLGTRRELPRWDRFGEDLVEGIKLMLVIAVLWMPAAVLVLALTLLVAGATNTALAWLPAILIGPPAVLITTFYLPAALLSVVATDELGAAFDVERVFAAIGRMGGAYFLAFLFALAAEVVAQLGLMVFCVGIFATRFIGHTMAVHAFATVYRESAPRPELVQATG